MSVTSEVGLTTDWDLAKHPCSSNTTSFIPLRFRKSHDTSKKKRNFIQIVVVSILLYGRTAWTLTKRIEKKLRAILNKSWKQHPIKQYLYSHQPPISKTIQIRRTKHAGHCWRSKDELMSDVLLFMGQIKIFNHLLYLLPFNCVQTNA